MQERNENTLTLSEKIMAFNEKLTQENSSRPKKKLTMFPRTAKRGIDANLVSIKNNSIMLMKDKITKFF